MQGERAGRGGILLLCCLQVALGFRHSSVLIGGHASGRFALLAPRKPVAASAALPRMQQQQDRPDLSAEEVRLLERRMGEGSRFTQKQMFREEIESPFRKTRLFLVPALAASAALGVFISGTRLLAAATGVTGYDVDETLQNLLVNAGAVVGLTFLYLNDKRSRDLDLERIARSGQLAKLQLRLFSESGKEVLFRLSALRKTRRLAVVVGGPEAWRRPAKWRRRGKRHSMRLGPSWFLSSGRNFVMTPLSHPPTHRARDGCYHAWRRPCERVNGRNGCR